MRQVNYLFIGLLSAIAFCYVGAFVTATAQVSNSTVAVPTSELLKSTADIWLATVGSALSLILIGLKFLDSWLRSRKQSALNDKLISVVGAAKDSIEGSDNWIKDNIVAHKQDMYDLFNIFAQNKTIDAVVQDPRFQGIIDRANARAVEATDEINKYYGWASQVGGLNSNNPNIAKLAAIESHLTPAGPSTIPPTATPEIRISTTPTNKDSDAV
jgi:hypothetical protein